MAKSTKPSGLSIKRDKFKFTFTWKIPGSDKEKYTSQIVQYKIDPGGSWTSFSDVTRNTTSKKLSLSKSNYYPEHNTLIGAVSHNGIVETFETNDWKPKITKVSFRVCGKHGSNDTSDWAVKEFDVKPPSDVKVSSSLAADDTTVFGWGSPDKNGDHKWLRYAKYETILLQNWNEKNPEKVPAKKWKSSTRGWQTGETSDDSFSGSKTIKENTAASNVPGWLNDNSYTRIIRYKAYGPGGKSKHWKYAKHVYARPKKITPKDATSTVSANGTIVSFEYTSHSSAMFPVDFVDVQYLIETPISGRNAPTSGVSWSDAPNSVGLRDTSGGASTTFKIDQRPSYDQCLWVRANSNHDSITTQGDPFLVELGPLSKPTSLNPGTINTSTWITNMSATNASNVPDSYLVIRMYTNSDTNGKDIAIIPHGQSQVQSVHLPNPGDDTYWFSVRTVVGSNTYKVKDGVTYYKISTNAWVSEEYTLGGEVPLAPTGVSVAETTIAGTLRVSWNWDWALANAAELSWADHEDAWESTSGPTTYDVDSTNASAWNISGLATGVKWYIRVRLMKVVGDTTTYGPYSNIVSFDLASAPDVPSLVLSSGVITTTGTVTASWGYSTTDGTLQSNAKIAIVETVDNETQYTAIAETETTQHVTLDAAELGWAAGDTYNLALCVTSASGKMSNWSEPVSITVAEPLTLNILEEVITSLEAVEVELDGDSEIVTVSDVYTANATQATNREIDLKYPVYSDYTAIHSVEIDGYSNTIVPLTYGDDYTLINNKTIKLIDNSIPLSAGTRLYVTYDRYPLSLTEMPLTVTVATVVEGGTTSLVITRKGSYHLIQPDETELDGFDGETIYSASQDGDATFEIANDDLIGRFDDGAEYTLFVSIQDSLGQIASDQMDFYVHWNVQAVMPEAAVIIDDESMAAVLYPLAPSDATSDILTGATYDIYRLSVDKPVLVYKGAEIGSIYLDPYPTIGEFGGYRFVFKTANGDSITANNELAWLDVSSVYNSLYNVIDFGSDRAYIIYNVDLSSNWKKDFKETQYLGGSVQGDWNPAVSRTSNVSTVAVKSMDQTTISALRRLAIYPGVCHIRTLDGSSYSADVQVSESRGHEDSDLVVNFTLNITRVDDQEPDGIKYADWEDIQDTEGEES